MVDSTGSCIISEHCGSSSHIKAFSPSALHCFRETFLPLLRGRPVFKFVFVWKPFASWVAIALWVPQCPRHLHSGPDLSWLLLHAPLLGSLAFALTGTPSLSFITQKVGLIKYNYFGIHDAVILQFVKSWVCPVATIEIIWFHYHITVCHTSRRDHISLNSESLNYIEIFFHSKGCN